MEQQENPSSAEKPALLKAVEIVLAKPEHIKAETEQLLTSYRKKYSLKTDEEIKHRAAKKIVSNYSYFCAFIGGVTGLAGIIPGLGTVISTFGGTTADIALSMKYQIEMTMAIAVVYGHDITIEEEKRLCFLIAGLGAINEAAKEGGKTIGKKAFTKMVQQYLTGSTLVAIKQIFKKVGITFTQKAASKAIPFGIGVILSAGANKGITFYIGKKAIDFFKEN